MGNNKHLHTTGHPHAGHRAHGLLARPRVCRLAWRLCCAAVAVCLFSCDSDQPDYLEPRLTTLPATDLTRTEATLHGSATVAGETEMPQLYFRYGATEAMEQTAPAVFDDQTMVAARITGLTAATTYHYMLEGTNGRTTVRGDRMSLTTLPNAKPSLGEASIVGHGPMSVIIGYRITDDGGETITETGCLYALASAATLLLAVAAINFKADQTLVGTAMNLLGTAAATVFVKAMNTAAAPRPAPQHHLHDMALRHEPHGRDCGRGDHLHHGRRPAAGRARPTALVDGQELVRLLPPLHSRASEW